MKIIKTFALVSVLVFGMTTSAFASWWNPFTWHWFKKSTVVTTQQVSTDNLLLVEQDSKNEITIITNDGGITFDGGTILFAKDSNGKKLTVDYKDVKFYESFIRDGQEISRVGFFDIWLKQHKEISSHGYDGPGIPGTTKIIGVIDEQGVIQASKIIQQVQ